MDSFISFNLSKTIVSLTDNLDSYWKLDESSGNAADSVSSRTLTNSNVTYSAGKVNNCGVFNGSNARFQGSAWSPAGDYSISMWINADTLPTTTVPLTSLFCNYDVPSSAQDRGIDVILLNDGGTQKIQFFHGPYGGQVTASYTKTLTTGNWYHLVAVYNGSTVKLYLDGSEVASENASVDQPSLTKLINIGNFGYYTPLSSDLGRWFDGKIDEIAIWSKALSSTEVSTLYNSGNGLQYPFTAATSIKSINGLAIASVKSVNGLAIASVKSYNGLSNVS